MSSRSDVIVYHDETKQTGPNGNLRGHVLYFVPRCLEKESDVPLFETTSTEFQPQRILLERIEEILTEHDIGDHRLHFTDLSGRKWYPRTEAYRQIIALGVDSLRRHSPRHLGRATCCKMAVMLYPSNVDVSLYGGKTKEQVLRHDETIIRMLLKGALHYFYGPKRRVELVGIVSDGSPEHRSLDDWRILERIGRRDRLKTKELKEYVEIGEVAQILPISSDPKKYESGRRLEHARFLQVADLMLGATLRACFNDIGGCSVAPNIGERLESWKKKDVVASPVREMLAKRERGEGFRRSGHYRSFTVSKVDFEGDELSFQDVPLTRKKSIPDLFDS